MDGASAYVREAVLRGMEAVLMSYFGRTADFSPTATLVPCRLAGLCHTLGALALRTRFLTAFNEGTIRSQRVPVLDKGILK